MMRFFSQHGVLKKSYVNMEHLFLMSPRRTRAGDDGTRGRKHDRIRDHGLRTLPHLHPRGPRPLRVHRQHDDHQRRRSPITPTEQKLDRPNLTGRTAKVVRGLGWMISSGLYSQNGRCPDAKSSR
jgi:hypothetical protein